MNFKDKMKSMVAQRDARILEMRKNNMTLQEIGNTFGISREAVRQIIERKSVEPQNENMSRSQDA